MAIRPATIVANLRRVVLVIGVSALCGVLVAGVALPVVAGLGITAREGADAFSEMSADLEINEMKERSTVLDSDGKTLAVFFDNKDNTDGNRIYVPLDKISQAMIDATLAIEDDRFYDRGPVDFQGTIRALINNVSAGETTGGGSTLTQQYVKQVRFTQAKNAEERAEVIASEGVEGYRRKLEELRMAVAVEQKLTKDEILERYLNIAYFGNGAYGVEVAARTYFSKRAKKLTNREAALLAGMVQSPYAYDPVEKDRKDAARNRRDTVLNRMASTGRVSEKAINKAKAQNLGLNMNRQPNGCVDAWAGYYCDYVYHELLTMKELGKNKKQRAKTLMTGGLTIKTTIDRDQQDSAQEHVSDRADPTDEAIVSLAAVEPGTGYIKAMANSRNYGVAKEPGISSLNYAVDAKMGGGRGIQPGSTFKVFVLAAAIQQGIGLNTTIRSPDTVDYPTELETCEGSTTFAPEDAGNYEGADPGTYNLITGTEQSVNTFFIQLEERTGLCDPATIAQDAGVTRADAGSRDENGDKIPPELKQVPSFTLGVNEVSPLSMAEAYATFANRGVHCESTAILTVKDRGGKILVDHRKPKCERVIDAAVADTVNMVLQSVVDNGTGAAMQLGRPAAGKTGTSNGFMSVWFAGYTPQLATAVATADVDVPKVSLEGITLGGEYVAQAFGSTVPGPVWKEFMLDYHDDLDVEEFVEPDEETVRGETEKVPDVRGRSLDDAQAILSEAGFTASEIENRPSNEPEGTVIETSPGAYTDHTKGGYVGLIVSSGEKPGGGDEGGGDEGGGGDTGGDAGGDAGGDTGTDVGDE